MNKVLSMLLWLVIIALIIWGVVAFVKKGGDAPIDETGPITIGFIGPLTGDAAAYGEPIQSVVQLAVDEINAAGGINDRPIEVVYEDGACEGTTSANAAQKLVNVDKVQVVIGGFCSSESLAAEPITTAGGVFLVSGGSSSPDLTGVSDLFARTYPSDASQGEVLAGVAYNDKGWKKVAFIQEQLDYPLGIYNAFSDFFTFYGGEVVKEEFPTEETDFRTSLTKLRGENPDALFVDVQTPASGERVLKQLRDLGWEVPLLISDALIGDPDVVANNAEILEGALAAEFGIDPDNPKFQGLLELYSIAYGDDLPYQSYAQTIYDAVYMIRDAVNDVGYDGDNIAAWFREQDGWVGASGSVTIKKDGDRASGHTPKIIKDGKTESYTPTATE